MYSQFNRVKAAKSMPAEPGEGGAVLQDIDGVILEGRTECTCGRALCAKVHFADHTLRQHLDPGEIYEVEPFWGAGKAFKWLLIGAAVGALARPFLDNWVG